jgi:plastocyanin
MVNRREFLGAAGVAAALATAGCNTGAPGGSTPTGTPTATPEAPTISMNGSNAAGQMYFSPVGLHVDPGTTVRWTAESGQHSTTAFHPENDNELRIPEAADPWYSAAMSYTSFEHTLEAEGTYDYYCSIHYNHGMVGRIVVGDPGGPATGTETPYGRVPAADAIVEQGAISYGDFSD